jgi:hypothetical protein
MAERHEGVRKAIIALSDNSALADTRDAVLETLSDADLVKVVSDIWQDALSRDSRKAVASLLFDLAAKETKKQVPQRALQAQKGPRMGGSLVPVVDNGGRAMQRRAEPICKSLFATPMLRGSLPVVLNAGTYCGEMRYSFTAGVILLV